MSSRSFGGAVLSCWLLFATVQGVAANEDVVSPRLIALRAALARGDTYAESEFWAEIDRRAPLIEAGSNPDSMKVTFVWRAKPNETRSNVGVSGGFLVPSGKTREALRPLGGTAVWYHTVELPSASRFSYYIVAPQGREPAADANWRDEYDGVTYEFFADPLNANSYREPESGQAVSYVAGPSAPPDKYSRERAHVPRGLVETVQIPSRILGNSRAVSVYTPAGYSSRSRAMDFLLLFDRESYLSVVPTPTILDNMIADKAIPPLIAVLVSPIDDATRGNELPPNAEFQQFLSAELMPWVRATYKVTSDSARAVVAGSSYGGLAASFTALTHPKTFGNVISQSGSYWWGPDREDVGPNDSLLWAGSGWVAQQYAAAPRLQIRFYLDVGIWEGAEMLLPNRQLNSVLTAKGYDVTYREVAGGHDYFNWRITLSDGLMSTLGRH